MTYLKDKSSQNDIMCDHHAIVYDYFINNWQVYIDFREKLHNFVLEYLRCHKFVSEIKKNII